MGVRRLAAPAVRHWDFRRGVAGVGVLVRFAGERGVPAPDALAGSGLTVADLADPAREVGARQELAVLRNLVAAVGDEPGVGLALGARYHATTFGMLGFAVLSSRTLLDAVNVALRYLDLSFTFSIPSAELAGDVALLRLDDRALPADVAGFLVERDLAAMLNVVAELLPGGIPLRSVEFRAPDPSDVESHTAWLGVRPRFGRPANVTVFDVALLDRPLPQADPVTVAACEARCRALVSARRARTGIAHEVRDRLTGVSAARLDMEGVARELNISPRTLRRRLGEAGTTFRALRDEVRAALAEELLAGGGLSVEDVAVRLGYAEATSFIHAFRRWHGTTPAAYARQRGGAATVGGRNGMLTT
jgi:AraC-like DNA-binding protein